ncbi:MAG: MarR family transcriptional regulator [Alphaproteobacteria bacterium]|jgi:DNA-binding MarR family transcriptional regulator|nr:MarR family transcriptional regulator [Alphaproteobacteria bacterium]
MTNLTLDEPLVQHEGMRAVPSRNGSGNRLNLGHFLPHRLAVLAQCMNRILAHRCEDECGLTTAEWRLLAILAQYGALSANAVASYADMDKVRVSRAVSRAVDAGLVRRAIDRSDRRRSVLTLTPEGWAMHDRIVPALLDLESEILADLEDREIDALQVLACRLQERIGRMAEHVGDEDE